MGEALDEMKDPLGAQKEFRAAIAANPKQADVHFGLGYLLWTKAQYEEAAQQFEAEIKNNPQHTQAMLYLADTQMKTGKTAEAQASLEKLVKLMPQNAMAHRDLGSLYADAGQNDAAVMELSEAIRLGAMLRPWLSAVRATRTHRQPAARACGLAAATRARRTAGVEATAGDRRSHGCCVVSRQRPGAGSKAAAAVRGSDATAARPHLGGNH